MAENLTNVITGASPTDIYKVEGPRNIKPHPDTGRLIDSLPVLPRTRPMRLLCLGEPRTGTMSLMAGMKQLGMNPYHLATAMGDPKSSMYLWIEALRAKYEGKSKPWGREEFDKVLGDYDAVLDCPCICFAKELIDAYPEAKILLHTRDADAWTKSMNQTVGVVMKWNWSSIASYDKALVLPWYTFVSEVIQPYFFRSVIDFETPAGRKLFEDHYAKVRKYAPPERLLEYRVQEGWIPLCKFIGETVPQTEFPHVNDKSDFVKFHRLMWWFAVSKMIGKIGIAVGLPTIGLAAAIWLRRR